MTDSIPIMYCANHPDVETTLRCNRCEKPICPKCAVLTPTGYKCRECVRGQQKVFNTAIWYDYPVAFITASLLSFLGSLATSFIGFFILFVAPIFGGVIAEVVRLVVHRRRSRLLTRTIIVATAIGGLVMPLFLLLGMLLFRGAGGLGQLIWFGLYTILVTSTVTYRVAGIQVR